MAENGNITEVDPKEYLGSDAKNAAIQDAEEHKNEGKAEESKLSDNNEAHLKSKKNAKNE